MNACASPAATACTIVGGSAPRAAWRRSRSAVIFPATAATCCTDGRSEGRGLSLEALWDVAEDLQAERLVECLADYWCDEINLFAAFQPGRPVPPRIRLFVDFIAAAHLD